MYSHHHYNHDSISRENANAHPLGRPASMPSLYPSSSNDNYKVVNEDLMESHHHNHNHHHRSSLDGNGPYSNSSASVAATATTTGWTTHGSSSSGGNSNGWNHNHHQDNVNNSIGGNGGSNSNTTSPPPLPPPLSSMMNTNHGDNNNTTSSSSTTTKSNMDLPSIDKHYTNSMTSPSNASSTNLMSAYNSPNYFVSPTTTNTVYNSPHLSHHHQPPPPPPSSSHHHQQQHHQQQHNVGYSAYGMTSNMPSQSRHSLVARPKLTTTLWEDEGTICYQVDANGICVARRQDNDMINGTKLLNVAGMSRGKRDGILKNEKGRVVVKVGAMHLKGVWITFARAKLLSAQYKIQEILYPLFVDDPSVFLYTTALHNPITSSRMNGLNSYNRTQQYGSFSSSSVSSTGPGATSNSSSSANPTSPTNWDRHNNGNTSSSYRNAGFHGPMINHPNDDMFMLSSQVEYNNNNNNNHNSSGNRQSIGGLVGGYNSNNNNSGHTNSNGPYSVYQQQHEKSANAGPNNRMYFSDELLDDGAGKHDESTLYGHKSMLPGTLSSPTSSEAGNKTSAFHLPPSRGSGEYENTTTTTTATTTTSSTTSTSTTAERRQSLIMSTTPRVASPRHHPYVSPGKVYTPSIMSSLQSYRQSSIDEDRKDGGGNEMDGQQQQQSMAAAAAAAADINRHPW